MSIKWKLFPLRRVRAPPTTDNNTTPAVPTPPLPYPATPTSPGTRLEIKRIEKIYTERKWQLLELSSPTFDSPVSSTTIIPDNHARYAPYAEYAIILRRKIEHTRDTNDVPRITVKALIQSETLVRVVKHVLRDVPNLSWNTRPFKINPQLLLAFLPQLKTYLEDHCRSGSTPSSDNQTTTDHLSFLIQFLEDEYASTLAKTRALLSNHEVTFDLLWSVFLPRSILFTTCQTTSEPRAVRLLEIDKFSDRHCEPYWRLLCEYVNSTWEGKHQDKPFGMTTTEFKIHRFEGAVKITSLIAYPLERHPDSMAVREKLLLRGRKWLGLDGVHHWHYSGTAYYMESHIKVIIDGRVIIDRRTFADMNPEYKRPSHRRHFIDHPLVSNSDHETPDTEHILLATPLLYGFSLTDKRWLEFNVEHVNPIKWNNEVFDHLVIDPHRKVLVRSLVESHTEERSIDDIVEGKGLGLVFNLFGPPGVGKSLTVEAISEHLGKPLYVIGAGDLGTNPSTLDSKLTDIFHVAAKWKAVVLIDEADVFLEVRGTENLERNAMVAVFLRHLEYFSGILFLTTNRSKIFDPAFHSRIHLSLQYTDLTETAKEQIWKVFLSKAQNSPLGAQDITADQMQQLSKMNLNGRQIKNVVKVAVSLANDEKQPLGFQHLCGTIKAVVGHEA